MVDCAGCRKALSWQPTNERCAELSKVEQGGRECEKCPAPDGVGVVQDLEWLNFLVFDPPFPDGTLTPEGLVQIDKGGLSMLRESATDDEFKLTLAQMSADRPDRNLVGIVKVQTATLRTATDAPFLGVYDTPLEGKPHHCDILGAHVDPAIIGSKTKAEKARKRRIKQLIEYIGSPHLIPRNQFRDGTLVASATDP